MSIIHYPDSETTSVINFNSNAQRLVNNLSNKSFNISSSYGSSFSEMVSVSGNQIQFNSSSMRPDSEPSHGTLLNDYSNKSFILKFSEQDLKEYDII